MGRFVEGALRRKLRFAPQVGRTLPLDVCAAYTECWRCEKTTGLVIDLCFAASRVLAGAADVTADIYDFDDEGKGVTLLMEAIRAETLQIFYCWDGSATDHRAIMRKRCGTACGSSYRIHSKDPMVPGAGIEPARLSAGDLSPLRFEQLILGCARVLSEPRE